MGRRGGGERRKDSEKGGRMREGASSKSQNCTKKAAEGIVSKAI